VLAFWRGCLFWPQLVVDSVEIHEVDYVSQPRAKALQTKASFPTKSSRRKSGGT
jgi:hypothetical protein